MNTKFETNVATQIPKTKSSHEPRLPWEVTQKDLDSIQVDDLARKAAVIGKAPFGIKPIYVILLILATVAFILSASFSVVQSNKKARLNLQDTKQQNIMLIGKLQRTEKDLKSTLADKTHLEKQNSLLENNVANLETQSTTLNDQIKNLMDQNKESMSVIKKLTENEDGKSKDK